MRMQPVNYKELLLEIKAMLVHDVKHPEANINSIPEVFLEIEGQPPVPGLNLPSWPILSDSINGLRPNEFSILCGPTGAGKTTLLANIYALLIENNIPCFAAPVEVGKHSFVKKVVSILSGVPTLKIYDQAKVIKSKIGPKYLSNENMLVSTYQSRVNHLYLLADILHAYRTRGVKICLIDNLNFMMEPSDQESSIIQYDRIIHDWVVFHKHVPVHSFMVMHPKKTDNMRVESEGDIKGSSTAIQEAQNVFLFNRLKEGQFLDTKTPPDWCREIKIAKCREAGRSWGKKIYFELDLFSEKYKEIKNT